jgi:hypothetical protein
MRTTVKERLLRGCVPEPNTGCWLWTRTQHRQGYGSLWVSGAMQYAHRVAFCEFLGDPGTLNVLHRCDVPACINPDHLFLGTHADNMQDMVRKGRSRPSGARGEQCGRGVLTEAVVGRLRALVASGTSIAEAARIEAVKYRTAVAAVHGRNWRHLDKSQAMPMVAA